MRRHVLPAAFFALVIGGAALIGSMLNGGQLSGQERTVVPAVAVKPVRESSAESRDLTKLTPQQRHFYLSAKGGMEWLLRVNRADGRFLPGFIPALRTPLDSDNYLHQAGATLALARAATFFHDDRAAAVAKQALLTLLLETAVDPKTQARHTAAPEAFLNRLSTAGYLTLAIHELPNPANDLLQHADQLTHYLRLQQQPDGSFACAADDPKARAGIIQTCSGPALHALMRSHALRPAAWKVDSVKKATTHYHAWWKQNKNLTMVPDHTAANAEAFLATKEQAFADRVFEMNDWLCGVQIANVDHRRAHWAGGFPPTGEGSAAPDIRSATAAASLVEACRVARAAGDAARLNRYRAALEGCLLFVTTLQYTEANTQHFADAYRHAYLVGGFHHSHQDGNLRIDSAQHALAALVHYCKHVAELP
jgi:hypothetical protein